MKPIQRTYQGILHNNNSRWQLYSDDIEDLTEKFKEFEGDYVVIQVRRPAQGEYE